MTKSFNAYFESDAVMGAITLQNRGYQTRINYPQLIEGVLPTYKVEYWKSRKNKVSK